MENLITSNNLALLSIGIAFVSLLISYKNIEIRKESFFLHKIDKVSLHPIVEYIKSEQFEDFFIVHLNLYNPSMEGAIIYSLKVCEEIKHFNIFRKLLGYVCWQELFDAKWWPASDLNDYEVKIMSDGYKDLYVKDQQDILVRIPGLLSQNRYKFLIKTNLGSSDIHMTIGEICSYFPHDHNARLL